MSSLRVRQVTVEAEDDGQRLDRWIKKRAPEIPYALAQKLIRTGAIKVDGKKAKTDTRLSEGQQVRLPPVEDRGSDSPKREKPLTQDDEKYIRSMVMYDDGDVVALNKPGDIASQGGGGVERHIDGLLALIPDLKGRRPRLIHRLDRDTSGILLCARSPEAVRQLGFAFSDRQALKIYWAIVTPAPVDQSGTVNAPLAKADGPLKDRMIISEGEDSKHAITDFYVLERAAKTAAFVALVPQTGRTHQLRVHMADVLECPILGDKKYGGDKQKIDGADIADRLHLHARRLVLNHPTKKGEKLDLTAPLPSELVKSWDAFGFDQEIGNAFVPRSRKEKKKS